MTRMEFRPWMARPLLAGVLLVGLSGAAAPPAQTTDTRTTRARMGEALTQPFADLNLKRSKIPGVLIKAAEAPYAPPADCPGLRDEVIKLDAVLGPDVDAPPVERGMVRTAASNAAVDAVRGATTGWIPFRGVVRRVTGAERHAEIQRQAVLAGMTRRAYLKGVGQQMGCFGGPTIDAPSPQVAQTDVTRIEAPDAAAPVLKVENASDSTVADVPAAADQSGSDAVEEHASGDTALNAGFADAALTPAPQR